MVTPQLGLLLADEPTAHLDTETAQAVIQGLMAVAQRGTTVIVATHDERILPYMDKVVQLSPVYSGEAV
jgi:ATP-binding cassette subfamily C protein CydD